MQLSASLNGSIATITATTPNNTTSLNVAGATNLSTELTAFVDDPTTALVDTPDYRLDPTDEGVRISVASGRIDLPWRWIASVVVELDA